MRSFCINLFLLVYGLTPHVSHAQTLKSEGRVLTPGNHMELIEYAIDDGALDFVVILHGEPGIKKPDFLEVTASSPDLVYKATLRRGDEVINLLGSKKMLVIDGREIVYFGPILLTLDELNSQKLGAYQQALERIKQRNKTTKK